MEKKRIIFCGGDKHLLYCAAFFNKEGYESLVWQGAPGDIINSSQRIRNLREVLDGAVAVVLPIPAFTLGGKLMCSDSGRGQWDSEYIFKTVNSKALILGGKINDITKRLASEYNCRIIDYGCREEFSLFNAVPTAEAAIKICMEILGKTLWGSSFTIIGYGRIGRALAGRIHHLGGDVTVAARSEAALSWAESDGMKGISLKDYLKSPPYADITINTVPCHIIDDETCTADTHSKFIDLASAPGGFTDEARLILGDRLTVALSLPGKYFPETAGSIIYKTVKGIIKNDKDGIKQ